MFKQTINATGFIAIALLSGCAAIDRHVLNPAAEASRVPPLVRSPTCVAYQYLDGSESSLDMTRWNNPFSKSECERQVDAVTDKELNAACKNTTMADLKECAAFLERKSESICSEHLSKIFGNRAVTNVTIGTLAAATGIAGGLVTGGAANALSGSAGFLTADRSLFNEEVYRNYVAEAVIKEIQKNREVAKANIDDAIAKGSDSNSLGAITGPQQVIQRVTEMHDACSFYAGLTSLVGNAGKDEYAVNLKTGVAAQLEALKSQRAALVDKITKLDTDTDPANKTKNSEDKAKLTTEIDALDRQIATTTQTLNFMAPGHVSDPGTTTTATVGTSPKVPSAP